MEHFSARREIDKYSLDLSTFDLIDVLRFHNLKCSTVFDYLFTWALLILSVVLLGIDIYTCLNILVFHRWSSDDYKPYAYSVAKWIFTGCIIFEFVLLFYHWIWAIHTYRTKNIALAYVNNIARHLYTIKSYDYHCLFNLVEHDNFFDWACFLAYFEMDSALQILVADTPRQVINILTLRYYATDQDSSNDIIENIKNIATTNIRLSVILSFMVLSVAIWSIFFFRFVFGMLCYIPCLVSIRKKGHSRLKKYCCSVVNQHVRKFVLRHHKPRSKLLEEGILDLKEINENPLLNSSTVTTFDSAFQYKPEVPKALQRNPYSNDSIPGYNSRQHTYESLPLQNMQRRRPPQDPFSDDNKASSTAHLMSNDPFADSNEDRDASDREDLYDQYRGISHDDVTGYSQPPRAPPRTGSASSLTFGDDYNRTPFTKEAVQKSHTQGTNTQYGTNIQYGTKQFGNRPYDNTQYGDTQDGNTQYGSQQANPLGTSYPLRKKVPRTDTLGTQNSQPIDDNEPPSAPYPHNSIKQPPLNSSTYPPQPESPPYSTGKPAGGEKAPYPIRESYNLNRDSDYFYDQ